MIRSCCLGIGSVVAAKMKTGTDRIEQPGGVRLGHVHRPADPAGGAGRQGALGALEPRWVCWHRGVEPPSGVQLGAVPSRAISRVLLRPLGQLADAWRDGHYIVLGRRQVGAA